MQEHFEKGADSSGEFEKARKTIHGVIERIRAIEHPEGTDRGDEVTALKAAVAHCSAEMDRLNYRYEQRGAELERVKAAYAELERMFQMRPDTMRKAGELEAVELVRRKRELAAAEEELVKAREAAAQERQRLEAEARGAAQERLAALEREYDGRRSRLELSEREYAAREEALRQAEARQRAGIEAARAAAAAEAAAAFEKERAALLENFAREKDALAAAAAGAKAKAAEAEARAAEARKTGQELERRALSAMESASAEAQRRRLVEMDRDAALARLAGWEKKGAELERWRGELEEREKACAGLEQRAVALEKDYAEKRAQLERVKDDMRAEIKELMRRRPGAEG